MRLTARGPGQPSVCVTNNPVQAAVGPGRRRTFLVRWVLPPGQRRPCPQVEQLSWRAEHILCFNLLF